LADFNYPNKFRSIARAITKSGTIYPITPSSHHGRVGRSVERRRPQKYLGHVPLIAEMQSEGGAAGAMHGALQAGAFGTTFTASQGLLLMIPNMFKIAGELTPATSCTSPPAPWPPMRSPSSATTPT
jgi:pyruvate-ferredoxin/flavodoxin oxidoreductase